VRLFNNQLHKLSGHETLFYPAALLEVGNVVFEGFNGGSEIQYGTCLIKVHVLHNSVAQGHELEVYTLKQTVHQYLHRFSGDRFNPLARTEELLDLDHDSLYDYQITYTTRFAEETQPLPADAAGTFPFDYTAATTAEKPA
jgi:hypothetical protein